MRLGSRVIVTPSGSPNPETTKEPFLAEVELQMQLGFFMVRRVRENDPKLIHVFGGWCRVLEQQFPLQTYTGLEVDYRYPELTEILTEDLRQQLTLIMRYAGARKWSVLQHTALCVLLAESKHLSALSVQYVAAHDLQEAYVLDVPTPLKQLLPDYRAIESAWEDRVHRSFGLCEPSRLASIGMHGGRIVEEVKRIDRLAFEVEVEFLDHPLAARFRSDRDPPGRDELFCAELVSKYSDDQLWHLVAVSLLAGV